MFYVGKILINLGGYIVINQIIKWYVREEVFKIMLTFL